MGCQRVVALLLAASLAGAVGGCGGADQTDRSEGGEGVLAVVNGQPVTKDEIEIRLEEMGAEAQQEFNSPSMLSSLINREINMRVWAEAARDAGIDKTPEFKSRLKEAETSVLAQMYTTEIERKATDFSEDQLRDAYERDIDDYSRPGTVHARQILCSSEAEAQEALAAVRGGMPFEQAVAKYSQDTVTKSKSGDLGNLSEASTIPGLGVDPKFVQQISKIETGDVGGPIRTKKGFHVVEVLGRTPPQVRPFSEVKAQLERKLKRERGESGVNRDLEGLWKRYNVTVDDAAIKRYIGYPVTPEEYIRDIREATSTGDKIHLCDEMVRQFPDNKYAAYALLTMGFVYSEELHNKVDSAKAFNLLIERYPDSHLVGAARWMLDNMQRDHPPIRNVEQLVEIAKSAGY
jgi:peptidyl-prolyl cis-trans isomerase C